MSVLLQFGKKNLITIFLKLCESEIQKIIVKRLKLRVTLHVMQRSWGLSFMFHYDYHIHQAVYLSARFLPRNRRGCAASHLCGPLLTYLS